MTAQPAGRAESGVGEHAPGERASPGLGALFSGMREGGGYAVLDLGPARPAHLRVLSPYVGQLRFSDLTHGATGILPAEAIRSLPENPVAPYDIVLAWDVLDRMRAEERTELIAKLADITGERARMFFMVDASGGQRRRALSFTLTGPGRVIQAEIGPPLPAVSELLPAAVERLLGPAFEVQSAFYVRSGWREYVVKRK